MNTAKTRVAFYILLTCFAVLLNIPAASSAETLIKLTAPVTDLSGKLLEGAPAELSEMIQELEADNGPKVKVLIISAPGEETLDVFAEKTLASQPNNLRPDALLVISANPSSARIAVAEKAQKLLNGVAVRSIIHESVIGYLSEGQYYSAIEQGVRNIEETLRGKKDFGPAQRASGVATQFSKTGKDGLIKIPPYAPVTDLTGTLAPRDIEGLRTEIASLEQKKGSQIAVLMLPSVKPETIEQFALRTFDAWKLGRKGVDDGVLIVAAKDERQMRIEVGYGFEGVLTDLISGRIIDEQMQPLFQKGDYGGGLTVGVQQIIKVIEGESLPPVKKEVYENQFPDKWVMITAGVIVLFCTVLRFWLPAWLCSLLSGFGAGGLVWINTMPSMALFAALFSAALTFILPGAILGGGGASSSGGFGGSSGGDSGGGGSSGGGGASGGW